ncbi:hypothetical protein DFA_05614 [Cavenderia fasciculata]|uniref:MRH domain-containing protein n=1 Tax=Cavenderia fasciculata TaxID=261658 RepID=F4PLQ9_CACFS|nr:uncharacterized protein DFA_05614 [Cavenderia fasciculata]EGG23481.1 hypothetical protein DFA_05614 [Cavenderia fasciculata]|eukprot:XP_004361332.1 hypothetical protein DFA_05614 [Cavenderia fasciculata]
MRLELLFSTLFIGLLLISVAISDEQATGCDAIVNLNAYDAAVKYNTLVTTVGLTLGSILGAIPVPGVGSALGAIAKQIVGTFKIDSSEYLAKFVQDTVTFAIECNDLNNMQLQLQSAYLSADNNVDCMYASESTVQFECTNGNRTFSFTNFRQHLYAQRPFFYYGVSDDVKSLSVKAATLPVFAQYANIYMASVRDQVLNVNSLTWSPEDKQLLLADLNTFASESIAYAQDIYTRYIATLPDGSLTADQFNDAAKTINMLQTGVMDHVYYWKYMDPFVYPFGAPPRPVTTMYTQMVGQHQDPAIISQDIREGDTWVRNEEFYPNPKTANTSPCTTPVFTNKAMVFNNVQSDICSTSVHGIGGINFIQHSPHAETLTGFGLSYDTLESAGWVELTKPNHITTVTTEYGNYIDRIKFGLRDNTSSPSIGDAEVGGNTDVKTFGNGYHLTGACVARYYVSYIKTVFGTYACIYESRTINVLYYLFSTVPVVSKPFAKAPVYRYREIDSVNGLSYMLSIHNNLVVPGWSLEGIAFGAFTPNFQDTTTVTIHQYHTISVDGRKRYTYEANGDIDLPGYIYDYPVFNVYSGLGAGRTAVSIFTSLDGNNFKVYTTETFIAGWSYTAYAWAADTTSIVPTVTTTLAGPDPVYRQIQSASNNLCLTADSTTNKPKLRACQAAADQIWNFKPNFQFGSQLVNTGSKLIISQNTATAPYVDAYLASFVNSFGTTLVYPAGNTNQQYMIKGSYGKCLSMPSTCTYADSNGYIYDLSALSSSSYNVQLDTSIYTMLFSVCNASPATCGNSALQSCQQSTTNQAIYKTGTFASQTTVTQSAAGLGQGIVLQYTSDVRTFKLNLTCSSASTSTPFKCHESPALTYTCSMSHPSACGTLESSPKLSYVACDSSDVKQLWSSPASQPTYTKDKIGTHLGGCLDVNEVFGPSSLLDGQSISNGGLSLSLASGLLTLSLNGANVWQAGSIKPDKGPFHATIQTDGNICVSSTLGGATYCAMTQGLGGTILNLLTPNAYGLNFAMMLTNPSGRMVWSQQGYPTSYKIALIPGSYLEAGAGDRSLLGPDQFITNGRDYLYAKTSADGYTFVVKFTTNNPLSTPTVRWQIDFPVQQGFSLLNYLEITDGGNVMYAGAPIGSFSLSTCHSAKIFDFNCDGLIAPSFAGLKYLHIPSPGSVEATDNAIVYRSATGSVLWGAFQSSNKYTNYATYPNDAPDRMTTRFLDVYSAPSAFTLTNTLTGVVFHTSPAGKVRCRKGWTTSHQFQVIYSNAANNCANGEYDILVFGQNAVNQGITFLLLPAMPEMVLLGSDGTYLDGTGWSTL